MRRSLMAQANPGGEYNMEPAAGSYIDPNTPKMRGMAQQQQVPPLPQGVIPGTDDYFAWLESTGLAKTPQDFQRMLKLHESMGAQGRPSVMDEILKAK